ncbi:type II toxin-antitoxin system Phd/YefM family antitoxin [Streptomyces jeddahensis]|uniref:Antitoxin n=1 Tax=Streptomyces jeddahensis TaxID=1716141 RepID=A0A177I0L1_9ACTN|nr:type II toxin-antitoxin system Phd/YefM family antitoxin [Streptomyces jeddahensis]OAH16477.1 hypothetical protein STSP_01350 [Streptomyces jeddahensis]
MKTVGLREFEQNPSEALALVESGLTVLVTDQGKPLLRLVPEAVSRTVPETGVPAALQRMLDSGDAHPPAEQGMPDLALELAPELPELSHLLVEERDRERRR